MDKETLQRAVSVQKSITELSIFKERLTGHVFSLERRMLNEVKQSSYEEETKKVLSLLIHKHLENMEEDLYFEILKYKNFLYGL